MSKQNWPHCLNIGSDPQVGHDIQIKNIFKVCPL